MKIRSRNNRPISMCLRQRGAVELYHRRQRGTVLVISLVILLILTILGISAMGTSSLEEKMAGNIQESTHAFESSESGLNEAFNTPGALSLSDDATTYTFSYNSGKSSAEVETEFKQFSTPKRGSGYSMKDFQAANFEQTSTGKTTAKAKAVIHQGVGLIVPGSN